MIRDIADSGTHSGVGRYLSFIGNLALWIVVAFNAWFLWPSSFGGATTFILVNGTSMQPAYEPGDLVVAREGEPAVGDIVVYRPPGYGDAKVVHQIVGGDGVTGWTMKGLDNDYVDPWKPTNDEVVGIVQVRFPSLGGAGAVLLSPLVWAAVLMIALGLLVWPGQEEEPAEEPDDGTGNVGGAPPRATRGTNPPSVRKAAS